MSTALASQLERAFYEQPGAWVAGVQREAMFAAITAALGPAAAAAATRVGATPRFAAAAISAVPDAEPSAQALLAAALHCAAAGGAGAPSPRPAVSPPRAPSTIDRTVSAQAAFDRSADLEARLAGAKNRLAGALVGRDNDERGSDAQQHERLRTLELALFQAQSSAGLRRTHSSAVAASLAEIEIEIERVRQARAARELSAVRAQIAQLRSTALDTEELFEGSAGGITAGSRSSGGGGRQVYNQKHIRVKAALAER